jgi:hypothetical protein
MASVDCPPSVRRSAQNSKSSKPVQRSTYRLREYARLPTGTEPERDEQKRLLFYCAEDQCLWSHGVSTNFLKHLRTKHNIFVKPQKSEVLQAAHEALQHLVRDNQIETQAPKAHDLSQETLRACIARLIVRHSLPFTAIEWPQLHSLLLLINPEVEDLLIVSRRTLVSDIKECWEKEKLELKEQLQLARSKIHISLDIWTSPNTYLFLGIVAHYVASNDNHSSSSLLALREIGGHAGEEQWHVLHTVLEDYGIVERLGNIIGDSAATNGTLCRTIHKYFSEELFMEWNYETNQIRCVGHIINLIVQAFLFGELQEDELENFERDEKQEYSIDIDKQKQRVRQQMSSMGKLHNIVVHIRSSAARTKAFCDNSEGKRIILDNRTRWNSWHNMLERALDLEKSVDFYLKNQSDLKLDVLKPKDWASLRTTTEFLSRFKATTKQLESDSDDISQVLPHLLHVRLWIKANQSKFTGKDGQPAPRTTAEDRDFLQRLQNAETAWQKWWDILWKNTTYLLATLLNPIYRTKWFREALRLINIDSRVVEEGLDRAKLLWLLWHQQKREEDQIARSKETLSAPKKRRTTLRRRTKAFETIYELNKRIIGDWESNDISEFEEYINQPVTIPPNEGKVFKALSWWCEADRTAKWPHLSSLAISVLSFPAMSTEPERVFSGARRTISWERSQLLPETIEVLECLKYLLRSKEKASRNVSSPTMPLDPALFAD